MRLAFVVGVYVRVLTGDVDLSTTAIELALKPLGDHLTCPICKASLQERTKHLMVQWALVKVRSLYAFPSSGF